MQVMKICEAKKREEYLKAVAPMGLGRFQHFATDEKKQEHLSAVKADQDAGIVPF